MTSGLVSVIIPVYNGERFLAAALASVAAQDYRPLEVVVVDDGSTDSTAVIVAAFFQRTGLPGHYHYQDNQGPATARNAGLKLAAGAWVAFLDTDDLWVPWKTSLQLQVLAQHPQAGVVWGDAIIIHDDAAAPPAPPMTSPRPHPMFLLQSMMIRRTTLEQIGPFDSTLRLGEDVDWIFRALEQGVRIVIHPGLVLYYRRHATNLTNDEDLTRRKYYSMIKRSLDRRRRQATSPAAQAWALIILPRTAAEPVQQ